MAETQSVQKSMTIEDFSNTFDLLFNNLMSDRAPEVNDYEKSMLLTMAQENVVNEIYYTSFEKDERSRRALAPLLEDVAIAKDGRGLYSEYYLPKDSSLVETEYKLPNDLLYIVMESVYIDDERACSNGSKIPVKPEPLDDLLYDIGNPFRSPSTARALREDKSGTTKYRDVKVKIYSKYELGDYCVKYIRRPKPILLADFSDESAYDQIHIRGVDTFKNDVYNGYGAELSDEPCELPLSIQQEIVNKAVLLAKAVFTS